MSSMKITALMENKAPEELKREHGLCLLAEYGGKTFLLDTGASNAFASNARKLGIDLSKADAAVLSHAHYDHSGGYNAFFAANSSAAVYLREGSKERCYMKLGPYRRYVGIPQGILDKYANRFKFISDDSEISDGVW
ncbi:MAG: MBL fold metallo-hydrolase, partial [Oscillospiraceae bacterium]